MRIIGIGVDIVEISRIEGLLARHGDRFTARVFVAGEQAYCGPQREPARGYAARFAAKEAVSKALGTGIGQRLGWLDIEVAREASGKPLLRLAGPGKELADELGVTELHLSLSHSDHYAVAQVIAVGG